MKYPKLPRKLNRACKLTEKDIENIQALRALDLTYQEIANEYGVSKQTIFYVLKSPEERKEINRKRHQRDTEEDKIRANESSKNARKYKRIVLAKKMKLAMREASSEYRKKNPEYSKMANKKYYYKKKIGDEWFGAIVRKKYRHRKLQ